MPLTSRIAEAAIPEQLYGRAMLIRAVEQRLLELFTEGKLFGTVHTCIGQEWTAVAVAEALAPGDLVFSNHRCHGHFLARTDDVEGLIAEIMGRATGVCGGRGGSQHLCAGGVFSNGIQGSIVPVAAGLAYAQRLAGEGRITVAFVGDGTLGEGALYEALNVASNWRLPLLVVLENNGYAQSTPSSQTLAGDICARAEAFGIETARTDVWRPGHALDVCRAAADYVRDQQAPFFVRFDAYRLMPHSKGDDERDKGEIEDHWRRDDLALFVRAHPDTARALGAQIKTRVDRAVATAEAAPYAEAANATATAQRVDTAPPRWQPTRIAEEDRVARRINRALHEALATDERVLLLGEDIESPYGGAFKVTRDLSTLYPGRVRNMPISEAAIVGLGNGLALAGRVAVCEIMFGDFMTLAFDQIMNSAAKFQYMYNDQVRVPIVVRTPMGGKRGYGPTHSQSLEKHFLGIPGTQVLAVHHRYDPVLLYGELFASIDRPTIVIENKLLYGTRTSDAVPQGFSLEHTLGSFPTTRIKPLAAGPADLTILCYGGMLPDVEAAIEALFDAHDVIAEVVVPARLYPLDLGPILESVAGSGRLLIAEEGVDFCAFGAEVVAQIAERAPDALRAVRRLGAPHHPIPGAGPLEKSLLPGTRHVLEAAVALAST